MQNSFSIDQLHATGLDTPAYLELFRQQAEQDLTGRSPEEAERIEFTKLNLHRSLRIARSHRLSDPLVAMLSKIETPQRWMVLTEPWCGDSAQCLPFIVAMAERNDSIELRVLLRDENPEVMDRYLTQGKRSIPILVAFDEEGRQLFRWGPRPALAQEVFDEARSESLQKPQIMERLHLFYGRDRGRALQEEFVELLGRLLERV